MWWQYRTYILHIDDCDRNSRIVQAKLDRMFLAGHKDLQVELQDLTPPSLSAISKEKSIRTDLNT